MVMWAFRRSGMADGLRFSAAAVLAFIVFGKVLSPQYLIWLFPFMAVLDGRTGSVARKIFLLCLPDHGDVLSRTRLRDGSRASGRADPAPEPPERASGLAVRDATVGPDDACGRH